MTQFQQSASVLTFGFKKFDPYAAMMFLRRWLAVILSVAAIVFLVSGAALMLIKPLYKAAALIQIDLNSAGVIDREAATARGAIDSGFVDSQIEVLKSPALVRRVVESLGLDKDPDFGRQKGGIFSFPSFLSRNWQAEPEASVTSPAVAKFIESLSIERRGSGYVISVGFTWPDPIKAAEYANALAHTYLEDQIATRSVQMQRAAAIFNEQIALLAVDVRNAEMAVEQFKTGTPGILEFMDADNQDLKDYMTYRDDLKISLMVANRSLNDPPPVLACPKLAQALDVLASRFDYVILDTPPLTPVIDSRLIANISTGIIFVVKWGDTPHEVVSQNLRHLVGTKARVLGVALNAMDLKRQKLYSRYGGGYYHSRYAVYYGSRQRSSVSRKWQDDTASDDGVESGVTGPQLRCSVSKD